MTKFQDQLIQTILSLSAEFGEPIGNIDKNPKGAYITGTISEYRFWIYDADEADFSSEFFDRRYEIADFKSSDELIDRFISELREAIQRKEYFREHPDKSPPPSLDRLLKHTKTE